MTAFWSTRIAHGAERAACPRAASATCGPRRRTTAAGRARSGLRPKPAHRLAVGPHHGRRDRRAARLERGADQPAVAAGQLQLGVQGGPVRRPDGLLPAQPRDALVDLGGREPGQGRLAAAPAPGGGPQPDPVVHRRADRPGLPVQVDPHPPTSCPTWVSCPGVRRSGAASSTAATSPVRSMIWPASPTSTGRAGNRGPRRRPAVLPRPVSRRARARCCAAHPCGPRAGVPRAPESSARTPAAARRPCPRHPRQRPPRHRRTGQPRPALPDSPRVATGTNPPSPSGLPMLTALRPRRRMRPRRPSTVASRRISRCRSGAAAASLPCFDYDVLLVGTGEPNNRPWSTFGDGIYQDDGRRQDLPRMGLRKPRPSRASSSVREIRGGVRRCAGASLRAQCGMSGIYKSTNGGRRVMRRSNSSTRTPGSPTWRSIRGAANVVYAASYQRRRTRVLLQWRWTR